MRAQQCDSTSFSNCFTACCALSPSCLEARVGRWEWRVFRDRSAFCWRGVAGQESCPRLCPEHTSCEPDPAHIAQKDCLYGVQFASYRVRFSTRGDFSLLRLISWSSAVDGASQRCERPADGRDWVVDVNGLRVAEIARAGSASIPVRRRRSLRGLPQRCGGLRRSRDPLGSDRPRRPRRSEPSTDAAAALRQYTRCGERENKRARE